jgi:hypothetical protein
MAIAAQRFRFLDNETNVAVKDFDTVFDNAVYNAPNADELFQEISDNLVSSIVGDDLINSLEDSLLSAKQIDLSNVNKIISDLLKQPGIQSSLTAAMKMFNINSSNYPAAVNSLISIMGNKFRNSASTTCPSTALLNAVGQSLQSSLLGQSAYFLSKTNEARLANNQCYANSSNSSITPLSALNFIENQNVRTINEPSNQNKENIWTSKDTYPYVRFSGTGVTEPEILMVNKVLLYRAIYYKYESENDPSINPAIYTFNLVQIRSLISVDHNYDYVRQLLAASTATDTDLKQLSDMIKAYDSSDPQALSIAADIDNYRILSHIQVQQKTYMYYFTRYIEVMKELVDNPIYIDLIKKYDSSSNYNSVVYMPEIERNLYHHVEGLYDFYKANRSALDTTDPMSIYDSMIKSAPSSSLGHPEIDYLTNLLPSGAFMSQLDYNMPTTSDRLFVK